MSGLYLLTVVGVWAGLSWLLFKGWQRLRRNVIARQRVVDVLCVGIALLWTGGALWYGGGRNIYYDIQVDRMCRTDGGIKIYETTKLTASEYDQFARGNWLIPDKSSARLSDKYYSETVRHYLRKGEPEISRRQYRITRASDGKVLGELTLYGRGGGDFPGPWHGSSHTCPDRATVSNFESSIFQRMDSQ